MAIFRFIHASDLHFSAEPDIINPFDSDGAIGALNELFTGQLGNGKSLLLSSFSPDKAGAFSWAVSDASLDVDAIIITGDLATTGFTKDLNAALSFFSGPAPMHWSPEKNSFVSLRSKDFPPLIIMPGNHDRYTEPFFFPRSIEFEDVFGQYWNFSEPGPKKFADHRFVRTTYLRKDEAILAICTVDFSLGSENEADGSFMAYMGQGRVCKGSSDGVQFALDELIEQTQWMQEAFKGISIVWCVHYPPHFPDVNQKLKLINDDLLVEVAVTHGIKLLLSGHTHEYKSYDTDGVKIVCCGTTTAAGNMHQNQYLELTIDTRKLADPHVVRKCWDKNVKDFVLS